LLIAGELCRKARRFAIGGTRHSRVGGNDDLLILDDSLLELNNDVPI
jgi:hypothetical protein